MEGKISSSTKENNEFIFKTMDQRFKDLMIWMSQNFPNKSEVGQIVDEKLLPVKQQISVLQDAVVSLGTKFTEISTFQQAEIQDIKIKIGLN